MMTCRQLDPTIMLRMQGWGGGVMRVDNTADDRDDIVNSDDIRDKTKITACIDDSKPGPTPCFRDIVVGCSEMLLATCTVIVNSMLKLFLCKMTILQYFGFHVFLVG